MPKKKRWIYFILIIVTILLGIGTRSQDAVLPELIRVYGGDVLSATCIFWGVRFVAVMKSLWRAAIIAYLICIVIETFQLYQAPWIQKIRHTYPFGILLGFGFLWSDWICYAVGLLLALPIAWPTERLTDRKTSPEML